MIRYNRLFTTVPTPSFYMGPHFTSNMEPLDIKVSFYRLGTDRMKMNLFKFLNHHGMSSFCITFHFHVTDHAKHVASFQVFFNTFSSRPDRFTTVKKMLRNYKKVDWCTQFAFCVCVFFWTKLKYSRRSWYAWQDSCVDENH